MDLTASLMPKLESQRKTDPTKQLVIKLISPFMFKLKPQKNNGLDHATCDQVYITGKDGYAYQLYYQQVGTMKNHESDYAIYDQVCISVKNGTDRNFHFQVRTTEQHKFDHGICH